MSDEVQGAHLRTPEAIYAESFRLIAEEADFSHLAPQTHHIAARIIHACGLPQLAGDLVISPDVQQRAEAALRAGRPIFADVEMVRAGIMRRLLPQGVEVRCLLNDARTEQLAARHRTTRTAAAVLLWREQLEDAICVIGNAPTALFQLIELIEAGAALPAVVLAFPVGFVGAAEAKSAFIQLAQARNIAHAAIMGRAGGAGMAAAAMNALLLASVCSSHAERDSN